MSTDGHRQKKRRDYNMPTKLLPLVWIKARQSLTFKNQQLSWKEHSGSIQKLSTRPQKGFKSCTCTDKINRLLYSLYSDFLYLSSDVYLCITISCVMLSAAAGRPNSRTVSVDLMTKYVLKKCCLLKGAHDMLNQKSLNSATAFPTELSRSSHYITLSKQFKVLGHISSHS